MNRETVYKVLEVLIGRKVKELAGLTIVVFDPEGDEPGREILGGIGINDEGEIRRLVPCELHGRGEKCTDLKATFEGAKPFSLVKLRENPGYWCPCGSMRCWCPR